jgi:hypothetical protein
MAKSLPTADKTGRRPPSQSKVRTLAPRPAPARAKALSVPRRDPRARRSR